MAWPTVKPLTSKHMAIAKSMFESRISQLESDVAAWRRSWADLSNRYRVARNHLISYGVCPDCGEVCQSGATWIECEIHGRAETNKEKTYGNANE